jgi:putative membrane protein
MATELTVKKNYNPLVIVLSIAIIGLVALAFFLPKFDFLKNKDLSMLPLVNAILNSITFISLSTALIAIKRKNIPLHKKMIFTALSSTALFLVTYLVYHFGAPHTLYGGTGLLKAIYLFILLTHIVLAAAIVPLALLSLARGLNMQVEKHRKIARWTMPIWLYVSLTGVIVYIMISPYYK